MFTKLGDILPQVAKSQGTMHQIDAASVCASYKGCASEVFSAKFLLHSRAKSYKNKVLTIATDHPIYATEIYQKRHILLKKLAEKLPNSDILEIRTVIDRKEPEYMA